MVRVCSGGRKGGREAYQDKRDKKWLDVIFSRQIKWDSVHHFWMTSKQHDLKLWHLIICLVPASSMKQQRNKCNRGNQSTQRKRMRIYWKYANTRRTLDQVLRWMKLRYNEVMQQVELQWHFKNSFQQQSFQFISKQLNFNVQCYFSDQYSCQSNRQKNVPFTCWSNNTVVLLTAPKPVNTKTKTLVPRNN